MIRNPNYQLLPQKCSCHYALLQLFSASYTVLQMKNSVKVISAINPVTTEIWTIPIYKRTVGKPYIVLAQLNTLGCQQKEMGHKGGQR